MGQVSWTNSALNEVVIVAGGQTGYDILGGFTVLQKQQIGGIVTVVFDFHHRSIVGNAAAFGAWGLHVVTDDSIAIGEFPDPRASGDSDSNWYWYQPFYSDASQLDTARIHGQTRTRRRIPTKSSMAFVLDNDSAADASVEFGVNLRVLLSWR